MAERFGDYCPIAMANEVIGDRWSPLVLRELIIGETRFNDIHRGIPRIGRSVLAGRLKWLERNGLVERVPRPDSQAVDYVLTEAGRDLEPIIFGMGRWGAKWVFGDPSDEQIDTTHLVWRLHQFTDPDRAPDERTTVEVRTHGAGAGRAWIVFEERASTACQIDPGYDIDLLVTADARELHRWYHGHAEWNDLCRAGAITVQGPKRLASAFPTWFRPAFADDVRAARRGV